MDDDCNGSFNDLTRENLKELGNDCGVTVAGTACVKGKVAGCNRQLDNPFFTAKAVGFPSSDRYLVCTGDTKPRTEICNGFDDNCDGSLEASLSERDSDGDTFLACTNCTYDPTEVWLFNKATYSYCNDCNDTQALGSNFYPSVPCLTATDCTGVAGKPACAIDATPDPSKNACVPCLASTDCAGVRRLSG